MSTPNQHDHDKRNEATPGGLIRLGCCHCDRMDCDGIEAYPTDWTRIQPVNQSSLLGWETHLGICPDCQKADDDFASSDEDTPPWEEPEQNSGKSTTVHPIIAQIIDRDCHVGTSDREVVRHVISRLRHGYDTFRAMPPADRELLIEQAIQHHRRNFKLYVEVMSGFSRTTGKTPANLPHKLNGKEIIALMRKHKITIEGLAFRLGTTKKRVREIRKVGLYGGLVVRDWLQAITGEDLGPIPTSYRIRNKSESADCGYCGCPLIPGDQAYEYVGEVFCSTTCCRKSRGW